MSEEAIGDVGDINDDDRLEKIGVERPDLLGRLPDLPGRLCSSRVDPASKEAAVA
jgi:hypothetical protein